MTVEEDRPVSVAEPGVPAVPPGLWSAPEVLQACREQHFGRLLKSYRELQSPPLTQQQLASLLCLTQGQLSRIERGRTATKDLKKLAVWATTIGVPGSILWFRPDESSHRPAEPSSEQANGPAGSSADEPGPSVAATSIGVTVAGTSKLREDRAESISSISSTEMESVEIMRMYTHTFRRIDNRYGGGHSLRTLTGTCGTRWFREFGRVVSRGRSARHCSPRLPSSTRWRDGVPTMQASRTRAGGVCAARSSCVRLSTTKRTLLNCWRV